MMPRMVALLNLLTLLKSESKRKTELWFTRAFRNKIELTKTLRCAKKAGLIAVDHIVVEPYNIVLGRRPRHIWYALTDLGMKFLESYPTWEVRPPKQVLGVCDEKPYMKSER